MPNTPEFTLLMPCLNEAKTLATCIRKAHAGAQAAGVAQYEILIADNGSSDGSQAIASAEGARVVHVPRRGYGAALQGGIEAAQGRYILMADADDSYDWSQIAPFVERLRAGDELVMGTRLRGKILPGAMPPLHRWLGNPVLTFIGRVLFRTPLSDFHCGLRGFERAAILRLSLHTPGMEFATEMVAKAALARFKMSEVPITYYPDGRDRRPHLRTWRDGWRHLSFMIMLSPNWLLLFPGLLLSVLGALGALLLLPGALHIGDLILDIHSFISFCFALIIGVQLLALWVIARTAAIYMQLIPPPAKPAFGDRLSLNTGLLAGGLLVLLGAALSLLAAQSWAAVSFGEIINFRLTLRLLLPGLTLGAIGIQVFFTSFVVGLLRFRSE